MLHCSNFLKWLKFSVMISFNKPGFHKTSALSPTEFRINSRVNFCKATAHTKHGILFYEKMS